MQGKWIFLAVCTLACAAGQAQSKAYPDAGGYITAVSEKGFSLAGFPVELGPGTKLFTMQGKEQIAVDRLPPVYLGEVMEIWGTFDAKTHVLRAGYVHAWEPSSFRVSGTGVIDGLETEDTPGVRLLRADGYRLRLDQQTRLRAGSRINTLSEITTNQWIAFKGTEDADGIVHVNEAVVTPNVVTEGEAKLRRNKEYAAENVSEDDKQSGVSKFFLGKNVKKLPVHGDAALQARVERIGHKLVPRYQQELPESDATKINFRFQTVDDEDQLSAIGLSSGIILVPYPAVGRLTSDAQIAAIVAEGIATSLEKQEMLLQPVDHRLLAAELAGDVAGAFVPGLGIAAGMVSGQIYSHVLTLQQRQSGRVSLSLMQEAGYDPAEAPMAWWVLANHKGKPLEEVSMPEQTVNQYWMLGTAWRERSAAGKVEEAHSSR